jgi:hypothetical protein
VLWILFILATTASARLQAEKVYFRVLSHAYGAGHGWTDCAVIRIRYKDFSAGTHAGAGSHGRTEGCAGAATVYLVPGLTGWQRRAVIRRLRQEASRGFGPPLPLPQLVTALVVDQVRTAARIVKSTIRLHPAVTLVPGAFVVAMMTLFVVAAGDRAGAPPGPRGRLADATAVSGGSGGAAGTGLGGARTTGVTDAGRAGGTAAGGTGLGSGQRALVKESRGDVSAGTPPVRVSVRPGAWYVCPLAVTAATSRPGGVQLACHRPALRAVPHTAHLPGPLDFAW